MNPESLDVACDCVPRDHDGFCASTGDPAGEISHPQSSNRSRWGQRESCNAQAAPAR